MRPSVDALSGATRGQRSARVPMGGWVEEIQSGRHHDPVPEEGSEDELPPQIHKVPEKVWSITHSFEQRSILHYCCLWFPLEVQGCLLFY